MKSIKIPVKFPVTGNFAAETGSQLTASSAMYHYFLALRWLRVPSMFVWGALKRRLGLARFANVFAGCNGTDQQAAWFLSYTLESVNYCRHKNVPAVLAFSTNNNPNPNPSILF
jgi:hypothetical protein